MNKTYLSFLFLIILSSSCQQKKQQQNVAEVTFQIDMSQVIADIENPETIGVIGSGPLEWRMTPLKEDSNGLYSITLDLAVEEVDTIEYTFMHSYDKFDNAHLGVAAYRTLILTPGSHVLPVVKWGEMEINTGRATPAPMLKVEQSDTEAEKKALGEPYYGITTDGEIIPGLFSIQATGISTAEIKSATGNFLNSLTSEQRASCTFPIDNQEWQRWSNIDFYKRKGIGLPELTADQKSMAFQILQKSLSPAGFKKTQDIMKMEGYLARLSNEYELLGPDLYWFSFMGEPSDTEPWGWQIDGHHLVVNYFILGDQIVMTPTFMGSEPNYIADGDNAGTRTFENEKKLGLKLYTSLDEDQKEKATLFDRKDYNYNQTGSYRDNAIVAYSGLKESALSESQFPILKELIQEYISTMKEGHAKLRMEEIVNHFDDTYFSWVGATDASGPFYYRIQSPVVLIEFDHQKPIFLEGSKPSKKHVHTIVRTPNGNDYGRDLLRQHLEAEHHH